MTHVPVPSAAGIRRTQNLPGRFFIPRPRQDHPDGWTLSQALEVIGYLIDPRLDIRGTSDRRREGRSDEA